MFEGYELGILSLFMLAIVFPIWLYKVRYDRRKAEKQESA